MTSIYALCEPGTDIVRYVGKTIHDPADRLNGHLWDQSRTHKCNWLRSLNGVRPELRTVVATEDRYGSAAERFTIALLNAAGATLTNATDGGEGSSGYVHSP